MTVAKKTKILSPDERWEQGVDHDDRSIKLIDALIEIDEKFNDGNMDIRVGGDGDNGEELSYLLDIYFEQQDALKSADGPTNS